MIMKIFEFVINDAITRELSHCLKYIYSKIISCENFITFISIEMID